MKVFIVFHGYDYEGEGIRAAFDNYNKAHTFLLEQIKGLDTELRDDEWRVFRNFHGRYESGEYWRIHEEEVQ